MAHPGLNGAERVFDRLAAVCAAQGITRINGTYLPTAKNLLVRDFYATIGFAVTAENADGSRNFTLAPLSGYVPKNEVMEVIPL